MNKIKEWLVANYPRVQFIFDGYAKFLGRIGVRGKIALCVGVVFLTSIGLEFLSLWFAEKSDGDRLQALASIIGNILGVVGAVIAVMIGIKHNESKEKEKVTLIERGLGLCAHMNLLIAENLYLTVKNVSAFAMIPDAIESPKSLHASISWEPFDTNHDVLHQISSMLVFSSNSVKVVQDRISTVFRKLENQVMLEQELKKELELACYDYLGACIFLCDCLNVPVNPVVRKQYAGLWDLDKEASDNAKFR
ncbi:MAG: hypothetical protein O9320_01645 [Magnetospirillum sp.]|nr:hypothetical protein [Magnetospirillum sp.]